MTDAAAPPSAHKSKKANKAARKSVAADAPMNDASAPAAAAAPFSAAAAALSSGAGAAASSALATLPRFLHPLHRCRFLTFLPHAIISLAFSPSGRLLALGRSNGNVELWVVGANPAQLPSASSSSSAAGGSSGVGASQGGSNGWVLLKTVPGSGEATVQVLMWARGSRGGQERLFSAGLNGRLIEWDLVGLAPKFASDTYGGAVWSGSIQETMVDGSRTLTIALGCEDGTIRLFDVSDASAPPLYSKALSRHSSRILSVAWSPDANFLATGGSDGMIKLWDLRNDGRNILRITVENKGLRRTTLAEGNKPGGKGGNAKTKKYKSADAAERYETYVWSVVFLSGSTLMSGDSLGNLQVWELEFGTLRQTFPKALQGDVLTMALNKQRNVLYASGVEGKIVELKRVSMSVEKKDMMASASGAASSSSTPTAGDDEANDASCKWILTANHRQHTHDVYALALSPMTLPQVAGKTNAAQTMPLPNNYLLVSGGVDTQLLLSPTTCFPDYSTLTRLLPFPQSRGGVCVADNILAPADDQEEDVEQDDEDSAPALKKLPARFLITHDQHLQLYALGSYAYEQTADKMRNKELLVNENDTLPLDKAYTHLLDINVNSRKSVDTSNPSASIWVPGGGLNLLCSAMSPDSRFIACSDPIQVKLYYVQHKKGSSNPNLLSVNKIKVNHLLQPANVLTFSADSTRLFVATLAGPVQILDLTSLFAEGSDDEEDEEPKVQTLEEHVPAAVYEGDLSSSSEDEDEDMTSGKNKKKQPLASQKSRLGVLRCLSVSSDQQYLCVSDEFSRAWVYDLDSMKLRATLPSFTEHILALDFHPTNAANLAILCARNTLYLYDVDAQKMSEYSKHNLGALAVGGSVGAQGQTSAAGVAAGVGAAGSGGVSSGNVLAPAAHLLAREQLSSMSWDRSNLGGGSNLLLQGVGLLLLVNLDRPRPAQGPAQVLAGAQAQAALSASQLNRRDKKRKADGLAAAAAGEEGAAVANGADASASTTTPDPFQVNFRVVTRFKPMLFAGFIDESDGTHKYKAPATPAAATSEGKKKRKKDAASDAASSAAEVTPAATTAATDFSVDVSASRPVVVGSSMLVIESPWVNILQQLPQPLARHRYGT